MNEITELLNSPRRDKPHDARCVLPLIYEELRGLAAQKLSQEKPGHTLQATALVHEAFLRIGGSDDQRWESRGHYFAAAAEAMRRILIENARRKKRLKHGGDVQRIVLADHPEPCTDDRLIALDEAIRKLSEEDTVAAKVVELRHFAGLGHEQIAATLQLTVYQARRKWTYARAWLTDALRS